MFQECRHIMPSGARCHSPALGVKPYCYFHARLHNLAVQPAKPGNPAKVEPAVIEIDPLEDPSAVQLTITRVLTALGSGRIDTKLLIRLVTERFNAPDGRFARALMRIVNRNLDSRFARLGIK